MGANTLTERYVHAVVRRIPADQRDDVAQELRATITDAVEAREGKAVASGGDRPAPERAVLMEMGDPIRLAARYADRPLTLIGPTLYPTYLRLLTLLLSTVAPLVTAVLVIVEVVEGNSAGSAIGAGIGGLLTVGAQIFAWLTVIFALIERAQHRAGTPATDTWTPDDLPEIRSTDRAPLGPSLAVAWNAALLALIVWQHTARPYPADGADGGTDRLEVLNPTLWSGWIWPILAGLAAIVALHLVRIVVGRWTVALASGYAVAEAVFALPLGWVLLQRDVFNPAFLADVGGVTTDAFYPAAATGVLALSVYEVVQRFREVSR